MKKLNQIQFNSLIKNLSDQDKFKCLALIILIIIEKYHEPYDLKFLKTWGKRMINKANRYYIRIKRKKEQCKDRS
jgi:hypothetical protein